MATNTVPSRAGSSGQMFRALGALRHHVRRAHPVRRGRRAVQGGRPHPRRRGKPVAITGFGTAAYQGAGDRGGRVLEILEYDEGTGAPVRLDGEYVRDEAGQATYLREVLEVFDTEGVDGTFVFTFALYDFPHRPDGDPRLDLDMASLGIVKMLEGRSGGAYPGMDWEPKAAFTAVAECYRS